MHYFESYPTRKPALQFGTNNIAMYKFLIGNVFHIQKNSILEKANRRNMFSMHSQVQQYVLKFCFKMHQT